MNYERYFKNKKITLMGLGLLGRGIGVAKFLAKNGARLTVTDLKTKKELTLALRELKEDKDISYVLGRHRLADFQNCDLVIKAAGVPLDSPYVAEAKKNNIPVKMDASLFLELAPQITSVGITGTRGKSTVTHLIFAIIRAYLKQRKRNRKKVYLAGNILGTATLPLLKKVKAGDIVVLELDSWQLQGFGDSAISPSIAVFTNLMPDHLNYYGGDMKKYFRDKQYIYRHQTAGDYLIIGKSISPLIRKSGGIKDRLVEAKPLPADWKLKIPGRHNQDNITLAVAVSQSLKISETVIKKTVENFAGLPGRLEFIREYQSVKYYNDTTATMPAATIAALRALSDDQEKKKNVILISGGADKNLDYAKYGEEIPKYVKKLILFPGLASQKIKKALPKRFRKQIIYVGSMAEAVRQAKKYSANGDIIILSPAAASFGPPPGGFKNEFDRGDQFVAAVKKLK